MDRHHDAAQLLLSARRDMTQRLNTLPEALRPRSHEQAYLIQRSIMRELGEIGGWKVGSPGPTGGFTCAPLPSRSILPSPAEADCLDRGIEAEIAIRLAAALPPRTQPYAADDMLAAIESAHPVIEVLQSRYTDPGAVDAVSNLADSLSHHSLVVGAAIPDWQGIDLAQESVRVLIDGREVKRRTGNPAGGMLRLLLWMANVGAHWAGGLRAGQIVTTGSWTAKDTVSAGSQARVAFERCGEAAVRFAP